MSDFSYFLHQDGMIMAEVSAPSADQGLREIMHYAMVYAQDGAVSISEPPGQDTLHMLASPLPAPPPDRPAGSGLDYQGTRGLFGYGER